jgi:pilus assembly protein CpaC
MSYPSEKTGFLRGAAWLLLTLATLSPAARAEEGVRIERGPNPIGRYHPRLAGLPAGTLPPVGTTPVPDERVRQKFARYVGEIVDPENTLDLVAGRPRLIRLKAAPFRIQVADERLVTYNLLGPTEITVMGRGTGITVLNLWFRDPQNPRKQTVLRKQVNVLPGR